MNIQIAQIRTNECAHAKNTWTVSRIRSRSLHSRMRAFRNVLFGEHTNRLLRVVPRVRLYLLSSTIECQSQMSNHVSVEKVGFTFIQEIVTKKYKYIYSPLFSPVV